MSSPGLTLCWSGNIFQEVGGRGGLWSLGKAWTMELWGGFQEPHQEPGWQGLWPHGLMTDVHILE